MATEAQAFFDIKEKALAQFERADEPMTFDALFQIDFERLAAQFQSSDTRGLSAQERQYAIAEAAIEHYYGSLQRNHNEFRSATALPENAASLRERYGDYLHARWSPEHAGKPLRAQVTALTSSARKNAPHSLHIYTRALKHLETRARQDESVRGSLPFEQFRGNIRHTLSALYMERGLVPPHQREQLAASVALTYMTDREKRDLGISERWKAVRARHEQQRESSPLRHRARQLYESVAHHAQRLLQRVPAYRAFQAWRTDYEQPRRSLPSTGSATSSRKPDSQGRPTAHARSLDTQRDVTHSRSGERPAPAHTPTPEAQIATQSDAPSFDARETTEFDRISELEDHFEQRFAQHLGEHGDNYEFSVPPTHRDVNDLVADVLLDNERQRMKLARQAVERDDVHDTRAFYHSAGLPTPRELVHAATRAYTQAALSREATPLRYEYRERAYGHAHGEVSKHHSVAAAADAIEMKAVTQEQAETYQVLNHTYEEINRVFEAEVDKAGRDPFSVARDRDRHLRELYQNRGTLTPDDRRAAAEHVVGGIQQDMDVEQVHDVSDKDFETMLLPGHVSFLEQQAASVQNPALVQEDHVSHELGAGATDSRATADMEHPQSWASVDAARQYSEHRNRLREERHKRRNNTRENTAVERPKADREQKVQRFAAVEELPRDKEMTTLSTRTDFFGLAAGTVEIDGEEHVVVEDNTRFAVAPTGGRSFKDGEPIHLNKHINSQGQPEIDISLGGREPDEGLGR
jgi:hypothetical protein